jgi:glycosyltransferase involved in cell wall biosynthesis
MKTFILLITSVEQWGGAQKYVLLLADSLLSAGCRVYLIGGGRLSTRFDPLLSSRDFIYKPIAISQSFFSPLSDLLCVFRLIRTFLLIRPSAVLISSTKAGLLGRLASLLTRQRVIYTVHGVSFAPGNGRSLLLNFFLKSSESLLSWCTSSIIAVSNLDKQLLLSLGVSPARVVRVYNGVDDQSQDLDCDLPSGFSPDSINLISVARLAPQKDHATLLHAFAMLDCRDFLLHIVGDGPLLPPLRSLAQELGVEDRVFFHGEHCCVSPFYRHADVFVLASHYEGFPMSTLEALSFSLPVVVSDVGGSRELFEIDPCIGSLVPPRSVPLLASAIAKYADDDLRRNCSIRSRSLFEKYFTKEAMVGSTLAVVLD